MYIIIFIKDFVKKDITFIVICLLRLIWRLSFLFFSFISF